MTQKIEKRKMIRKGKENNHIGHTNGKEKKKQIQRKIKLPNRK